MDDLGYGDVGSYGAPDAKTPNIDRLAREGVKFSKTFQPAGAVCNCAEWRACQASVRCDLRLGRPPRVRDARVDDGESEGLTVSTRAVWQRPVDCLCLKGSLP